MVVWSKIISDEEVELGIDIYEKHREEKKVFIVGAGDPDSREGPLRMRLMHSAFDVHGVWKRQ